MVVNEGGPKENWKRHSRKHQKDMGQKGEVKVAGIMNETVGGSKGEDQVGDLAI